MKINITYTCLKYILLILMVFVSCSNIYSQVYNNEKSILDGGKISSDSGSPQMNKRLPILNNFKFISNDVVSNPFINTYLNVSVGTGIAYDLKSYIKNFRGQVFDTVSGNLTYVSGEAGFQYAFNDWLAVNAGYSGGGRLGTNTYTVLSQGISYATNILLGAKVRIWNSEKILISSSLDFAYSQIYSYSFYAYIKRAVENGTGSLVKDSLLMKDATTKTILSGNIAYAPASWIGFLGVAGFGLGEPFQQKIRGNLRLGGSAALDFKNVKGLSVPIGVSLSARYNSFSETAEDVNDIMTFGLGLSYTGHKDFEVSVESIYQYLNYPEKVEERIKFFQTFAKIRYYF